MFSKKTPEPVKKPAAAEPAKPVPDSQDAGQATIFNTKPSRFERMVDEVLKKHKL